MKRSWNLELIDCRGVGRKTGKGTSYANEGAARAAFEAARTLEVSKECAAFLVDLHNDNGDLLDTIRIDASGFEALIGEPPKSVAVYDAVDRRYWKDARAARDAARG